MDSKIQKLRYNGALLKSDIKLKRGKNNCKIVAGKNSCNHIEVILGLFHSKTYLDRRSKNSKCLFCGNNIFETPTPVINAAFYRSEIYGNGSTEEKRVARLKEIQNLWKKYISENPNFTEAQLIEKIRETIKEDVEKNRQFQKRIKREV